MAEDLEGITNKLTVRENDVLAVVHPKIAQSIHDGIELITKDEPFVQTSDVRIRPYEGRYMVIDSINTDSAIPISTDESGKPTNKYPNKLSSEMIYGFFGEIGYVDLIQQKGFPKLIGIVHIPRRLVYLIGAAKGDEGIENFYNEFCNETEGN